MVAVTVSEELLEPARNYARSHALPLDQAIARLIGLGLAHAGADGGSEVQPSEIATFRLINGFGQFVVPSGTPVLTTEELLRIEDEH